MDAPVAVTAMEGLLSRASVGRLREPVPDGPALDLILRAAMRAPDHGRLRPWRFVVIRGAAREAFADLAERALRRRSPDVDEEIVQRQRGKILGRPLLIALGAHVRPDSNIPEIEQLLSVGAAAMNMLNAIHALGYGGVWVTGANCYDPAVAAALGFRAPDRLVGFLYVGTPAEDARPPLPRPDPAEYTVEWTGPAAPAG